MYDVQCYLVFQEVFIRVMNVLVTNREEGSVLS